MRRNVSRPPSFRHQKYKLPPTKQNGDLKSSHADELLELSTKSLSILSVGALILALTFDIGYFTGVDINFFTFFTLSEHILFVIQQLPFSIVVLGITITFVGLLNYHYITISDFYNRRGIIASIFWTVISICGTYGIFIILNTLIYPKPFFENDYTADTAYAAAFFSALTIICLSIIAAASIDIIKRYRHYFFSFIIYICSIIFASFVGYLSARSQISTSNKKIEQTIITKDSENIAARILRSGDKGVLFFDPSEKKAVFLRWENIDEVDSSRAKKH